MCSIYAFGKRVILKRWKVQAVMLRQPYNSETFCSNDNSSNIPINLVCVSLNKSEYDQEIPQTHTADQPAAP